MELGSWLLILLLASNETIELRLPAIVARVEQCAEVAKGLIQALNEPVKAFVCRQGV